MAVTQVYHNLRGWPAQTQSGSTLAEATYNFDFDLKSSSVWPGGSAPTTGHALVNFYVIWHADSSGYSNGYTIEAAYEIGSSTVSVAGASTSTTPDFVRNRLYTVPLPDGTITIAATGTSMRLQYVVNNTAAGAGTLDITVVPVAILAVKFT